MSHRLARLSVTRYGWPAPPQKRSFQGSAGEPIHRSREQPGALDDPAASSVTSHCVWNVAQQFGCERVRSIYGQRNNVMIITIVSTDVCHAQLKVHEIEPQLRRCF